MEDVSMTPHLTAFTAPGVFFSSDEELKTHYRTEWHRHNLKRKVANLKPLTREAFEARQTAGAAAEAAAAGSKRSQVKRKDPAVRTDDAEADDGRRLAHPQSKAAFYQRAAEMTEDEIIDARLQALPEHGLTPGVDIFSPHVSTSLEKNMQHMLLTHGFVVPYAEYVVDLPGLVRYLQEKVWIGCTALHSGAVFHSAAACQAHMRDKGACRYALESHEDEFYDYYDLHALADDSPNWHEEVLEAGEEDAEGGEEDEEDCVRVRVVYRPAAASATAGVDGGRAGSVVPGEADSLVLASGRELGHRSLRRYFGQSYRTEAPEQQQVHKLLLAYQQQGLIRVGALPAGAGVRSDRARRDLLRDQRSQLSLSMKNNTLMRKKGQPSQNIVFG